MVAPERENGFSLMELTVALAVVTIVMGIAFGLLNRFQQTYRYEEAYAEAQRNARFAMGRLNEIIRSAGTNPKRNTTINDVPFIIFGEDGSSIKLISDLDGDRNFTTSVSSNADVIVTSEDVTLQLDRETSSIVMIDNTPLAPADRKQTTVADSIRRLSFVDPDGSQREVVVNLVAIPSGIAEGDPRYREVRFTSTIRLRNR